MSGVILLAESSLEEGNKFNPVMGATREQLEAGRIEGGRLPVKMVENRDASGSSAWTAMTLTEADWTEKLKLDSSPRWS